MSNWMYNVISNGIEGTQLGGVGADCHGLYDDIVGDAKLHGFLTQVKYRTFALLDGYIESIPKYNKAQRNKFALMNLKNTKPNGRIGREINALKMKMIRELSSELTLRDYDALMKKRAFTPFQVERVMELQKLRKTYPVISEVQINKAIGYKVTERAKLAYTGKMRGTLKYLYRGTES